MPSQEGLTLWLTGLPGAGKTTLAHMIGKKLHTIGLPVEILDGDVVRRGFSKELGFTREDRDENIRRIAFAAKMLVRVGTVAIVAAISPYAKARNDARSEIGNFVEVFVRCPLKICIQRDPKGLYAKAQQGKVLQLTGLTDPYEEPLTPDVIVDTDRETPQESLEKIFQCLSTGNFIQFPSTTTSLKRSLSPPGDNKDSTLSST